MNLTSAIELVAVLVSSFGVLWLIKPWRRVRSLVLIVTVGLVGVDAILHLCDFLEWYGFRAMDRLGDDFRTLLPLLWLLFVLSLEQESLARDLAVQRDHADFFLDETPLAAVIIDGEGRVLDVSRDWAERSGSTRAALRGVLLTEYPGTPKLLVTGALEGVTRGRTSLHSDGPTLHEWNGKREWLIWQVRAHFDEEKKLVRLTLVATVVTNDVEQENERRQAARALFEAQRVELVGQLAATVAHDLNNFLHAIVANAETVASDATPIELDVARTSILDAAQSSAELVRSLTGLSRSRGASIQVELGSLVRSTAQLLQRSMPLSVHVELAIPDCAQIVRGDRTRLQQALVNLLVNARDAMPDGGTVRVELQDRGELAVLSVEDTGMGIPSELQGRIFERFFTTKGATSGTGLGLALVSAVAEEHGGQVTVRSQPKHGATFSLILPKIGITDPAKPPHAQIH